MDLTDQRAGVGSLLLPLNAPCYFLVVAAEEGIYVETLIHGDIAEVWNHTQIPDLHELWDLRFSAIQYLPKEAQDAPQRFHYSTRIGFGLKIDGEGESKGTREDMSGLRTSALKFWSADPKSLIKEGSGYWQYIPTSSGVRFLTWYDYRTRFGVVGRIVDRLLFRPLIGWATAWSFDRLRLWVDEGVPPRTSLHLALIHASSRMGIAFIWLWQGLVPKLLFPSPDERAMMLAAGLPVSMLPVIGVCEVLFGVVTAVFWRCRFLFPVNAVVMLLALAAITLRSPSYLVAAFNPVTLNLGVVLLSIAGYLSSDQLPSASRCLRRAPQAAE